jgi:hypothetical protein
VAAAQLDNLPRHRLASLRIEMIEHIIYNDRQSRAALRRFSAKPIPETEVKLLGCTPAQLVDGHPSVSRIEHDKLALVLGCRKPFVTARA